MLQKWSLAFASIQHMHAQLMMASFALHLFGCFDWLNPDDLSPMPARIRLAVFRLDPLYFMVTVNPPILRIVRVITINGA
eukprot:COSAG01_NODE_525_length_15926_cov_28.158021_17_plen_80_part_00